MKDLTAPQKKFRPELEGIRAVAALLVAVYHIWLGKVSGGVDVFFIVSGYLITTSLLFKMEKYSSVNYGEYLLGLGKRLYPVAFIVIIFSSIMSMFILPLTQWKQVINESLASAFYFQNWRLAFDSVDYLAQNNAASPFQHFWALSLQGQFYVTWPIIIFITYWIAKKILKTPFRKTFLAVLTIFFITSISFSTYITEVNQPWAYFNTFARVWEFSLGGILAILIPYINVKRPFNTILGWLGLAIVMFTGILLPVSSVFPGYAALLPTAGVILVIISSEATDRFGVQRLLGTKPFQYFGGISYGFYLWHWPLLVFYLTYFNVEKVSLMAGVMIIIISIFLSILSTKIVEAPIRTLNVKTAKRKLIPIITSMIVGILVANLYVNFTLKETIASIQENFDIANYPGAEVISNPDLEVNPYAIPLQVHPDAESNLPTMYADRCYMEMNQSGVKVCSYGEVENPEYTIALVGGSHSGHWFPALEGFVDELNIKLDVYNKDACRFSTGDAGGALSESCMDWNEKIIDPLTQNPPDLIFTTANVGKGSTVPKGYADMWSKFEGISTIFAIRDNPRMKENNPSCVELKGAEACSVPREEALSDEIPWEVTDNLPSNVVYADLSNYFCDEDTCHSVIGNVMVYRDVHHISTLYSQTLAEPLKQEIVKALEYVDEKKKLSN